MRSSITGVALAILLSTAALAQQNSLVGAWERVSQTNDKGEASPTPYMLVIFTSDGVFSQTNIARDRPQRDKPLNELTNEELRARLAGSQAVYGTYTVTGDRLTRTVVGALNPANEGRQITSRFKTDNDTLIAWDPDTKAESRFTRVRDGSLSAR